ncbi:hypothetical protein FKW77_007211 [Venturia effusa]|uniref:Uncharacterized protein n=1 Tax=Venturia effusa TaxID=50376 RepID=A0A517LB45_9PEZI|nr:hypothetical protein FKW77_007211 [Venturia effusa]
MHFPLIISLAALTLAFPNAEPLANPFALNTRSIGDKCDHNGIKGTCEKKCQGGFQTVGDCPDGESQSSPPPLHCTLEAGNPLIPYKTPDPANL